MGFSGTALPGKAVEMVSIQEKAETARDQIDNLRGIVQTSFQHAVSMEPLRLQHLLRDIDRKLMEINQGLKPEESQKRKKRA